MRKQSPTNEERRDEINLKEKEQLNEINNKVGDNNIENSQTKSEINILNDYAILLKKHVNYEVNLF